MERRDFLKGLFGGIAVTYAAAQIPISIIDKSESNKDFKILDSHGEPLEDIREPIIDKVDALLDQGYMTFADQTTGGYNLGCKTDQEYLWKQRAEWNKIIERYGFDIVNDEYESVSLAGVSISKYNIIVSNQLRLVTDTNILKAEWHEIMMKDKSYWGENHRRNWELR